MKKINWGIIGLGNIANQFANAFSIVDNANIKGIASLDKDKLQSFKERFNVDDKLCFDNYKDLISSSIIDIIYIALPNSLHAKYIRECIDKKKKVLVEKPAFIDLKDLTTIKDTLQKEKIFFTEGFMYRYLPYFEKLKEIVENNFLGKIVNIHSTFNIKVYKQKNFFGIKIKKPDYSNRLFNKELGGGAILDVGCYPLSLSTFINSLTYNVKLKDITLENVCSKHCESGVDIFSNLTLNFGNKFYSQITCSFKDNPNQKTMIDFEKGSLTINKPWLPDKEMFILQKKGDEILKINFRNNENIYSYQIQNISNQIIQDKKTPCFPSMTLEEIEVNTKILEDWINFKAV